MVGYFLIVNNLQLVIFGYCSVNKICRSIDKFGNGFLHIACEVSGICTGVSAELLFIKRLNKIQSLLCRISEFLVCISLERSKVIEQRCFFFLCLTSNSVTGCKIIVFTICKDVFCFFLAFDFIGFRLKVTAFKLNVVIRCRLKSINFRLTGNDEGKSGCYHSADIKGAMINNRKESGKIYAYKPVRLCSAIGGEIQIIVKL